MDQWQTNLENLANQFNAAVTGSVGLHHLLIEMSDKDRGVEAPPWFLSVNPQFFAPQIQSRHDAKWSCFSHHVSSAASPYYRAVNEAESERYHLASEGDGVIRDRKGRPRAILERSRIKSSFYCGDNSRYSQFQSLGGAAARALLDIPRDVMARLPTALSEMCRRRPSVSEYRFGNLRTIYPPITSGWAATVFQEDDGVVIFCPDAVAEHDSELWLSFLYRTAWQGLGGNFLKADRKTWKNSWTLPYKMNFPQSAEDPKSLMPPKIEGDYFYSVLGTPEAPLDLMLASASGIQSFLHYCQKQPSAAGATKKPIEIFISYSHLDIKFLDEFKPHAKSLEKVAAVKFWSDERLKPSDEWRQELLNAMERSTIAIVMLSANYLASDFCTDVELTSFLEARRVRGLLIFGILLSACLYDKSQLSAIQLLPKDSRNNLRPVIETRQRAKVWTNILRHIIDAIDDIH